MQPPSHPKPHPQGVWGIPWPWVGGGGCPEPGTYIKYYNINYKWAIFHGYVKLSKGKHVDFGEHWLILRVGMSTAGRHPKFMGSYGLNDKPSDENQPRGKLAVAIHTWQQNNQWQLLILMKTWLEFSIAWDCWFVCYLYPQSPVQLSQLVKSVRGIHMCPAWRMSFGTRPSMRMYLWSVLGIRFMIDSRHYTDLHSIAQSEIVSSDGWQKSPSDGFKTWSSRRTDGRSSSTSPQADSGSHGDGLVAALPAWNGTDWITACENKMTRKYRLYSLVIHLWPFKESR